MLPNQAGLFSGFPNELTREILRYCGPADLASLCRTEAKLLHIAATERLYTDLDLRVPRKAVQVFKTMLKRPLAAASVRTLIIKLRPKRLGVLHNFIRLAASAIHKATGITRFRLLSPNDTQLVHLLALQNTRLPRLVDCVLPHSTHIYRFLHQSGTSKLESLQISSSADIIDDSKALEEVPGISLPCLEYLAAPATTIPILVPRSAARRVSILWFREDDEKSIVPYLTKSITGVENMVLDWEEIPKIMLALGESLPDLTILRFSGMGISLPGNTHEMLELVETLSRPFKGLVSAAFAFENVRWNLRDGLDQIFEDFDTEFDAAVRWGKLHPSLQDITLPSTLTKWVRKFDDVFLPEVGPNDRGLPIHAFWLGRTLDKGKLADLADVQSIALLEPFRRLLLSYEGPEVLCGGISEDRDMDDLEGEDEADGEQDEDEDEDESGDESEGGGDTGGPAIAEA